MTHELYMPTPGRATQHYLLRFDDNLVDANLAIAAVCNAVVVDQRLTWDLADMLIAEIRRLARLDPVEDAKARATNELWS